VHFGSFKNMVVPVCYYASTNAHTVDAGEHWMLLVVDTQRQQVCVVNSVPSPKYDTGASAFIEGWK
jgi:hypothetical protein